MTPVLAQNASSALSTTLAERIKPTHASSTTASSALGQIFALATQIQQQVALYRGQILEAEASNPSIAPETERLHQVLGHIQTATEDLFRAGRNSGRAMQKLEEYLAEFASQNPAP